MSAKIRSIGIIRLEPVALDRLGGICDDSRLDMVLASLAQRSYLSDVPMRQPVRFGARRRLNWSVSSNVDNSVQVHVAQLIDDLQAEFERAESAGL